MLVLAGLDVLHCRKHSRINSFLSDTNSANITQQSEIFKTSVLDIHIPNYSTGNLVCTPSGRCKWRMLLVRYVTSYISIQLYQLCSHVFESEAMSCEVCGHFSSGSSSIQLKGFSIAQTSYEGNFKKGTHILFGKVHCHRKLIKCNSQDNWTLAKECRC